MTDPAAMEGMMGMMKGNVAMMVSQTLIMGWINAFFSGFVISMFPQTIPSSAGASFGQAPSGTIEAGATLQRALVYAKNLCSAASIRL
jgi:hypothetical protein